MKTSLQKNSLKILFCAVLSVCGALAFSIPSAKDACAATFPAPGPTVTPAETPCDPAYFRSMEQRAWLEAQREISQNQNLIFKPDSVLDYTCFGRYTWELADHAQQMFSENTRWGNNVLGGDQDQHMNNAMELLVVRALNVYLNSNFTTASNRNLLGGRSDITGINVPANISNGSSYECDIMQRVWQEAKCYNFQHERFDGFFTFQQYADGDVERQFPDPDNPCAEPTTLYTNAITAAGLNPETRPPWALDATQTYLDRMDAAECGTFPPIATGVIVTRNEQTPQRYYEGVCLQPGCHYDPIGGLPDTPRAGGPARCVP